MRNLNYCQYYQLLYYLIDYLLKLILQGFTINTNTGKELARSLEETKKESNPYFNTMLKILATRCMLQAVYFISGMQQAEEFKHYGLACPIYTHFTSPIRR